MRRLILNDLVANAGIWFGALFVAAAAGAAGSVAAGLIETSFGITLRQALGLDVIGSALILLTLVAALVVLSSVTRLTVTLQRRGYALWQLIGMPAFTVTAVVRTQVVIVAAVGATAGCLIAGPFVPQFLEFGLSDSQGLRRLDERFGVLSGLWVVVAVTVVVWFSGLTATRQAGRVHAIEALRDPAPRESGMTWLRWALTGLTLVIAVSMTASLGRGDLVDGGSQILLIGPMFTASAAAAGPILFPAVLRTWTAVVPVRASSAWFLARNATAYDVSRSSATVSPLLITMALPGSIYAGFFTFSNAVTAATGSGRTALAPQSFLLLLGGPLLLSLAGAAATVAMAGRTRERESALIRSAGGTQGVVLSRAVWEAVITVFTAVIVSGLVLVVTGVGAAVALNQVAPGTMPGFGVRAAGLAAGVSLLLILAANVVPTALATRHPVAQVLAAE